MVDKMFDFFCVKIERWNKKLFSHIFIVKFEILSKNYRLFTI